MQNLLIRVVLVVVGLVIVALAGGFVYELISEGQDARRFPAPGQLYSVNGRQLHLWCLGSGSPTVILEASGASSSIQWWPIQEELAEFSHVCSYDRAGFGWSDPSPSELSFEDNARYLKALLSAAEVPGPYILVGHSKGGLYVRTYAQLYPQDVAGMLLLDATEEEALFGQFEVVERSVAEAGTQGLQARFGNLRLILRFASGSLPFPFIPEEIRPAFFSELARSDYWKAAARDGDSYHLTPAEMRVAGGFGGLGDIPLIVITHGIPFTGGMATLEEGFLESQERLASLSTNSELLVAEKSGHAIMWDEPDLVVDSVRRLVEKEY